MSNEMKMVVSTKEKVDGFYKVDIKPAVGCTYQRQFTLDGLKEYLDSAKAYCDHKGYRFVYKDFVHYLCQQ